MIRPLAWVGRKQFYKGRHKFPQDNISWRKACCDLALLASGESQQPLSFAYLIGKPTLNRVIRETYDAIFEALAGEYSRPPSSIEEWKNIARDFQETWNLPHVVGGIDGKHIRIQCPKQSRTLFHNYKGFFSFVLLAICDARYCFTLFDVGQYGSNNDAGMLANFSIGKEIEAGEMNISPPRHQEGCSFDPLPYYLVGEEIFSLKIWLMRPYPGKLSEEERILHYQSSRTRRVITNTFGILAARWRIYHSPIIASIENAESYVLATIALHNYLRLTDNAVYTPVGFVVS